VSPLPGLQWPSTYQEVCQNSDSIFLDESDILVFINPNWVPVTATGGTGVFSGPGVVGNYFYPNTLGLHTITYTYTDSLGCTNSVFNTINVIFCCDTSCVVSAGADITACQGDAVILSATGCTGSITWYQITVEGPVAVGQGSILDVFPQVGTTCYVVECCCPGPVVCCSTDTVCVTVSPAPVLSWPVSFATVCRNSAPVLLNVADIFVDINFTWISVPFAGGTGYFSGTGVFGNQFNPTTVGSFLITYNYTDANGCTGTVTNSITVINCPCGPCHYPGFEIISNGTFDNGNTGFSSHLTENCSCYESSYCIRENAQMKCPSNMTIAAPGGLAGDQYLIVEGPASVSTMIWQQTVPVSSSSSYTFSFQLNPLLSAIYTEKPDLEVRLGSDVILSLQGTSLSNGWAEYAVQFTGIAGTSLEIHQIVSSPSTTIYGIDNISLRPCIPKVAISFSNVIHVTCFGGTNGSITANASGGTAPYTYLWNTGDTTQSISGLPAGTYTVTITDSLGCSNTVSFIIVEPSKVEGSTGVSPSTCNLFNGSAVAFPSGGAPGYTYLWSNGQTSQVASGLSAGSYSCLITDANGCTGIVFANVPNVGVFPDPIGPISGPAGACRGQTGVVYSVAPVSGASHYIWTLPPGVSGSSSGPSITLSFSSAYSGGFICVAPVNPCGTGPSVCFNIPVLSVKPSNPGFMSGPAFPCGPGLYTYSISPVMNALSYVWSVSGTGVAIMSGQGTNSVVVSVPAGFGQGRVSVYATNCMGNSARRDFTITGLAVHGNALSGPSFVCAGSMGVIYSIAPVNGASSYTWSVSSGDMSIASSTGPSCKVDFGASFTTGQLTVTTASPCGNFSKSYTLFSKPAQPGSISGPGSSLCGLSGVTYSISPVTGATAYSWTVPSGATIVMNTGLSITVDFGPSFTGTGNICVSASNACGTGISRCYTVSAAPAVPSPISGPASVCKASSAVMYTLSAVSGATHYSWYSTSGALIVPHGIGLAAGANFTGTSSSPVIITARAHNSCGLSQPATKSVAVDMMCRQIVPDPDAFNKFEVYPNPGTGLFKLAYSTAADTKFRVRILDILGNTVHLSDLEAKSGENNYELDLTFMVKGVYFISLERSGFDNQVTKITLIK
jgi:hypothetical protein